LAECTNTAYTTYTCIANATTTSPNAGSSDATTHAGSTNTSAGTDTDTSTADSCSRAQLPRVLRTEAALRRVDFHD
jgi:hypothetical protein